jgi:hypothetical protein
MWGKNIFFVCRLKQNIQKNGVFPRANIKRVKDCRKDGGTQLRQILQIQNHSVTKESCETEICMAEFFLKKQEKMSHDAWACDKSHQKKIIHDQDAYQERGSRPSDSTGGQVM